MRQIEGIKGWSASFDTLSQVLFLVVAALQTATLQPQALAGTVWRPARAVPNSLSYAIPTPFILAKAAMYAKMWLVRPD